MPKTSNARFCRFLKDALHDDSALLLRRLAQQMLAGVDCHASWLTLHCTAAADSAGSRRSCTHCRSTRLHCVTTVTLHCRKSNSRYRPSPKNNLAVAPAAELFLGPGSMAWQAKDFGERIMKLNLLRRGSLRSGS